MPSIYLLISISLVLFVVGIWAVYYAVKSHQFDDLDSAAQRIILDDRQDRREQLAKAVPEVGVTAVPTLDPALSSGKPPEKPSDTPL